MINNKRNGTQLITQKDPDNFEFESKHPTLSTRVIFILFVKPFSYGVLVVFLMLNTMLLTICIKGSTIFAIIIGANAFQLLPCLSFNKNLKFFKHIKYLILPFQRSNPNLSRMIINKNNKVECNTH